MSLNPVHSYPSRVLSHPKVVFNSRRLLYPALPVAKNSYLTFEPSDLDLSKNETLKDTSGVNLHPPTKFHEDRTKDLGGEEEQTNKQTNGQTLLEL